MLARRPLALLALAGTGAVVVLLVLHAATPPPPGRYLDLTAPPAAAAATSPVANAIPEASPTPAPATDAGPFSVLQVPLRNLFGQLNADTKASATGQYSLLQELEQGLRDRIDQFLHWVMGGRS